MNKTTHLTPDTNVEVIQVCIEAPATDEDFLQELLDEMNVQIEAMEIGDVAEAEELVSEDYWDSFTKAGHRQLGDLISNIVDRGLVSLVFNGIARNSRHNAYRKI